MKDPNAFKNLIMKMKIEEPYPNINIFPGDEKSPENDFEEKEEIKEEKKVINESTLNYFLSQAYVYENLINSNYFNQIDWTNKANENEEGETIILINQNSYKIKESKFPYDFIVTTNQNKKYYISVKWGRIGDFCEELKFTFNNSQWDLFKQEEIYLILAFVKLRDNDNPEIYYTKKDELNKFI